MAFADCSGDLSLGRRLRRWLLRALAGWEEGSRAAYGDVLVIRMDDEVFRYKKGVIPEKLGQLS